MKDAYYFSHDANARNDPKISAMRSVYGTEGYGRYWIVVEMLREQDGYRLSCDPSNWLAIAKQSDSNSKQTEEFVTECINTFKLFASDGAFFWSESLLRRMGKREQICRERAKAGRKGGKAKAKQLPSKSQAIAKQGKERKGKEREIDIAPHEQSILDEFVQVAGYPLEAEKDLAHIRKLAADYPNIDILAEAKKWATYKLDKPLDRKSNPRSQFRTWVSRAKPVPQSPPNTGAARTAEYLAQLEGRK